MLESLYSREEYDEDEARAFDEACSKRIKKTKKREKRKWKKKLKKNIIAECYTDEVEDSLDNKDALDYEYIPDPLNLSQHGNQGIPLGKINNTLVGILQGAEGHAVAIGGPGSGKSSGIAKPALRHWDGAFCATDIKGELSEYYQNLLANGVVTRPCIVFDPTQEESIGYDPFHEILQDPDNLVSNLWELVLILFPTTTSNSDPFWNESEQALLMAVLLYYYEQGSSFSSAMTYIVQYGTLNLCSTILRSEGNDIAKGFVGTADKMETETLASIDRGLRNKLLIFAYDKQINRIFRKKEDDSNCFTWADLDKYNIFIRIPEYKIETWSRPINLMYTQLIRHLERRPDKYSEIGEKNAPILLLMDEFARFGKLNAITDALATLRSKNVNIFLFIQSMAQLDKIYGEYDRRTFFDCCSYKIILRINDAESQQYISNLIGTHITLKKNEGKSMDCFFEITGYSEGLDETIEPIVFPHLLATLNDTLLLSPYGFYCLEKIKSYNNEANQL